MHMYIHVTTHTQPTTQVITIKPLSRRRGLWNGMNLILRRAVQSATRPATESSLTSNGLRKPLDFNWEANFDPDKWLAGWA